MSDTDYNKCICETCGGNCGCDAEIKRLRAKVAGLAALLDQVATESTNPDRDGPGCWWCTAESGEPHRDDCKYRQALAAADVEKEQQHGA